jgi:hypothetical protein
MARVFEFDVLKCPECNGRLKILAVIHPPFNTRKILECMGLPSRAPPIARAVFERTFEEFYRPLGNRLPRNLFSLLEIRVNDIEIASFIRSVVAGGSTT